MPAITIQSLELRNEQKEVLAEKFTTIFSELTNVPKDRIYVFFDGYTLDSVAKGESFRLKITRDAVADTAAGDAEVTKVEIRET